MRLLTTRWGMLDLAKEASTQYCRLNIDRCLDKDSIEVTMMYAKRGRDLLVMRHMCVCRVIMHVCVVIVHVCACMYMCTDVYVCMDVHVHIC